MGKVAFLVLDWIGLDFDIVEFVWTCIWCIVHVGLGEREKEWVGGDTTSAQRNTA